MKVLICMFFSTVWNELWPKGSGWCSICTHTSPVLQELSFWERSVFAVKRWGLSCRFLILFLKGDPCNHKWESINLLLCQEVFPIDAWTSVSGRQREKAITGSRQIMSTSPTWHLWVKRRWIKSSHLKSLHFPRPSWAGPMAFRIDGVLDRRTRNWSIITSRGWEGGQEPRNNPCSPMSTQRSGLQPAPQVINKTSGSFTRPYKGKF